MKEKRAVKAVIYHILVFAVGLVMIYPLIWMVMSSFKPTNTIFQTAGSLIPETFTFENYINGWKGFAKVTFATFFKNFPVYFSSGYHWNSDLFCQSLLTDLPDLSLRGKSFCFPPCFYP